MPRLVDQSPLTGNLVAFPGGRKLASAGDRAPNAAAAYRGLTRTLVLAKAARGELPPAVLEYLLDAAGVAP